MRIRMFVIGMPKQGSALSQQFHDDGVRGKHVLAFIFRQAFEVHPAIVEWRRGLQTVFLAGVEIVRAMTRRGMHDAASLIERHILREQARHFHGQERMLKFQSFKLTALKRSHHAGFFDAALRL